ncbi:hypothetical protein CYMTET_33627 [Cymbomonas tetramitiformis]|uniref:Uncharacterized protein n=1 Tax=Cymbomonas tetramitiformis TaxID=36881 RepID=A0AAE0FCT2_9CHLO|nr:hypothetical protein CYMTET_33627 [Cymbomonas tetramitiformis]
MAPVDASSALDGFTAEGRRAVVAWMAFDEDEIVHLWGVENEREENGNHEEIFIFALKSLKGIMQARRAQVTADTSGADANAGPAGASTGPR